VIPIENHVGSDGFHFQRRLLLLHPPSLGDGSAVGAEKRILGL